jgi:hypothetical protein
MSNSETVRVTVKDLNFGLEAEHTNLHGEWIMGDETRNIAMGRQIGMGPRHGMAPIPYQSSDPSNGTPAGGGYTLRASEYPDNGSLKPSTRTRVYAVKKFIVNGIESYAFVTDGVFGGSNSFYNIGLTCSNYTETALKTTIVNGIDADIASVIENAVIGFDDTAPNFRVRDRAHAFRKVSSKKNHIKSASINVAGQMFTTSIFFPGYSSTTRYNYYDCVTAIGAMSTSDNSLEVLTLGFNPANTTYRLNSKNIYDVWRNSGSNNISYFGWLSTQNVYTNANSPSYTFNNPDGANVGTTIGYLVRSKGIKQSSAYSAIAITAEKPIVAIMSFDTCTASGVVRQPPLQYLDPTDDHLFPIDRPTYTDPSLASRYSEDGVIKSTCFDSFPSFTSGTALPKDSAAAKDGKIHWTLGDAGSGILKKSTKYQVTYSIFDKSTAHETNVGTPATFQTTTDDAVCLTIYRQTASPTYSTAFSQTSQMALTIVNRLFMWHPLFPGTWSNIVASSYPRCNIEIRIYYREVGTFEWLPGGRFDYYDLFFDATRVSAKICEGAIAALPGPQPGGFVDGSALPADSYFDVTTYQNYMFWMSNKNLCYSNKNDVIGYPILNAVQANRGFFKGMIEHAYPGQSAQDSRLMVCTSDAVYIGRFKGAGYFQQFPVRVSMDTVATFDRPGSDFVLDFWTSQVPFSSRSMVIAEGILYWWGPTGIYRDLGNQIPDKQFSLHMEPYINENYDQGQTDAIHGIYDAQTKEIIWFYIPKDATTYKCKALVYNTKHDAFYEYQFANMVIDWSQYLDVSRKLINGGTIDQTRSGRRILVGIRSTESGFDTTPQQAVFFDTLCNSGDYNAPFQYLVKQISDAGGGNYRLTLNAHRKNPPATGRITIDGFNYYSNQTQSIDGIYTIVGSGAGYVDVTPPTGIASLPIWTASDPKFNFPIWVEAENGIECKFQSEYHEPMGAEFWGRWLYMWHRYRVELFKATIPPELTITFQGLLDTTPGASRTCTLVDNCATNCAIYSQIPQINEAAEGSAVRTAIYPTGGKWNGGRWYLQSCAFDIVPMSKENLRTWEG